MKQELLSGLETSSSIEHLDASIGAALGSLFFETEQKCIRSCYSRSRELPVLLAFHEENAIPLGLWPDIFDKAAKHDIRLTGIFEIFVALGGKFGKAKEEEGNRAALCGGVSAL